MWTSIVGGGGEATDLSSGHHFRRSRAAGRLVTPALIGYGHRSSSASPVRL